MNGSNRQGDRHRTCRLQYLIGFFKQTFAPVLFPVGAVRHRTRRRSVLWMTSVYSKRAGSKQLEKTADLPTSHGAPSNRPSARSSVSREKSIVLSTSVINRTFPRSFVTVQARAVGRRSIRTLYKRRQHNNRIGSVIYLSCLMCLEANGKIKLK